MFEGTKGERQIERTRKGPTRWVLPLVSAFVLALALPAAAASPEEQPTPFPGAPQFPPGPPMGDRDGDGISDDLEARLAEARPGDRFGVIVTLSGAANAASAERAVGPFEVKRVFSIIRGFAATMTRAQVEALAGTPGVLRIEEDFEVRAYLDDARSDFGVDNAADVFPTVTGLDVGICVVDSGMDASHEQLDNGKVVGFCNAVDGGCTVDGDGDAVAVMETAPFDDHGHGTHVASIAAGDGVGGPKAATYRGVAWDAPLYGAKVLKSDGTGTASDIIAGIDWCAGQPGVHVLNLSLGGLNTSDGTDVLSTAANCAADPAWINPSTGEPCPYPSRPPRVVVLAAGNAGPAHFQISSPAAAEQPITVGAVADWSDEAGKYRKGLAAFSSRGPTSDFRTKPDVTAPGVNITAAKAGKASNRYVTFNGTSMAAPFVAGAAALVLDANPGLTPQQVKDVFRVTAQYRGEPNAENKNYDWGWGLVDVFAAVAEASNVVYEPTAFPTYVRLDETIADFTELNHDFYVSDPDMEIAVTITNGGAWACAWVVFLGKLVCLQTSSGADFDAELYDPDGFLVDESTCEGDDDTYCGTGEWFAMGITGTMGRQETLLASPPVKLGTWTVRIYPFNGNALDDVAASPVGVDLSIGPLAGTAPPPPPDSSPTASITSPSAGDVVSGSVMVTANATDDVGVTQVEFFDDGASLGVDTDGADGWSAAWNTAGDGAHTLTATAMDTVGQTGSDNVGVTVDNTAPDVSITSPTGGSTVSGSVDVVADASDATSGVDQVQFFADASSIGLDTNGADGWSVSWNTAGVTDGNHDVTAVATDAAGNAKISDPVTVTVDNSATPASTMHVGDLDRSSTNQGKTWTATATVTVHMADETTLVDGATVSGSWSTGSEVTADLCTTGGSGTCSVSKSNIRKKDASVTFTVSDVTVGGSPDYEPTANHDPDGDSDGTSIAVLKP